MRTVDDLMQLQALPLSLKIRMTQERIRQWVYEFGENGVYVSFSGGKDSAVLLHIVRDLYPSIPAVFVDTGLEYPEIRQFVKKFENVEWLKPKKNFRQVIEEYGYPVISKEVSQSVHNVRVQAQKKRCDKRQTSLWDYYFNPDGERAKKAPQFIHAKYDFLNDAPFLISDKCCNVMKKNPAKQYEKKSGRRAIIGTMASESRLRKTEWIRHGCNAFECKRQISKPLSFWTEQDIYKYIRQYNIEICSVYGDVIEEDEIQGQITWQDIGMDIGGKRLKTTGCQRTGCMFCMFGCQSEKPNEGRFEIMKQTHPKQYEWIMKDWELGGLGYKSVIDWLNENGNLNIRY